MAKARMYSTSVQLSDKQLDYVEIIKEKIGTQSNAEVLRRALDFYVLNEFPQLAQN